MNAPFAGFLALVGAVYLGRKRGGGLGSDDNDHQYRAAIEVNALKRIMGKIDDATDCRERERLLSLAKHSATVAVTELDATSSAAPSHGDTRDELDRLRSALIPKMSTFRDECILLDPRTGPSHPRTQETEGERLMRFFSTPGWRP